ncbi:uncharacterized protein Nmlp_2150 [Natronomonas moolapensis 8.8.11]|uniref:RNA ligase domain-containing protein n=1 Tax=Natronomonas moolapensis (strain DSM 18674 / CECT 7526 / JCM 14361 / 8.8.11) TaxID=268739 RepID=M1Y1H7_NATM8|nr:RNA ligase family protein [Natronomonas moolapensis]CCQ36330.1 uncharacterized protein Nmlp_2150 [Natronomonas moolapensis 8.8.11]
MKQYPPIPRVTNAPEELFESGHLWVLEKIDGAILRFQLLNSGVLRFGDRSRVYDDPEAIPAPYGHAVRHVRERLDREALRDAVDDVESVVFFGEATHRHAIEYDWERLPSVLGFDVWSEREGSFRPPGAAQGIFERLGLESVNAVERELHTRDFDPGSYSVPESAWYDGPAEGVVIRNKRGGRAMLLHPDFREADGNPDARDADGTVPEDASAETLAETYATDRRFEKLARRLERRRGGVTFETLYERALTDIAREEYRRLYRGSPSIDRPAFRSAVAARTRAFLDGT